jgi:hypothetical protein
VRVPRRQGDAVAARGSFTDRESPDDAIRHTGS